MYKRQVLVVLGSILLTRNLKVDHISKRQAVLEMAYTCLLYTSSVQKLSQGLQ